MVPTLCAGPVTGPLAERDRDVAGGALQATLADLVDLALAAKQEHWNLVGRQFHDVHLHLDELVATARTYTDKVAERMATIGVSPDGRVGTVASTSQLGPVPGGWVSDQDVIQRTFELVNGVVARVRPRLAETEAPDPVSQDLLIELLRELEEARWMWQAQAAGYQGA